MQKLTIEAEYVRKQAAAKRDRISHDCLEHRPHVGRRGAYHTKNFGGRRPLLQRLVALAHYVAELFLGVVSGYVCGQRFASLGPSQVPTLHRFSTSTASLHVAPSAGHDDAQSYANPSIRAMTGLGGVIRRLPA
jgi:hypothetical protein